MGRAAPNFVETVREWLSAPWLAQLSPSPSPVAVGLGFAGLAGLAYAARQFWRAYRIVANDPSEVYDLSFTEGPVEVEGEAVALEDERTFQAPFSGADCLVCEYEIEEYRSTGKTNSWVSIHEAGAWVPFGVADDSGRVRVDPEGAQFELADHELRVDAGERPPERVRKYVELNDEVDPGSGTLDLKVVELQTGNDRKYVERRLEPGEPVYVFGEARSDSTAGRAVGDVNAVIGDGDAAPMFLVSDGGERGAAWRVARPGVWALIVAVIALGLGAAVGL